MTDRPARVGANPIGLIVIALSLTTQILAQSPRPPSDVDPARARFEDTNKRELQLRNMGGTPKKTDPKELEAVVAHIKQDFERILTLHNEIVRVISTDKALEHDFVSSATAEIKKRASRLQTTLALDKLEDSEQNQNQHKLKALNDAQLKDALISLCKEIESFVTNPVIKTPGTVDIQQLAKARRDLEGVIELGDSINKSAARLKKSSK
jgi:Fe-S-cluster formation regulator IscX/YfhJ